MKTLCYLIIIITLILVLLVIWSPDYKSELTQTFFVFLPFSVIGIGILAGDGFTEIDNKAKQKKV